MTKKNSAIKFHIPAFTLGLGATWSLSIFLVGLMAMFNWGGAFVDVMASIYIGYEPTFLGSLIGAVWAFFDGAIGGLVFALFYNFFLSKIKSR